MLVNYYLRQRSAKIAFLQCWNYCTKVATAKKEENTYSIEDQQKILQKLNESNSDELMRLKISPRRLARLESHRQQFGKFCSLDDVVRASGMGPAPMERLCNSILFPNTDEENGGSKTKFVKPQLSNSFRDTMKNVTGIHLQPNVVSWTRISRQGSVLDWNMHSLDLGSRKHPLDLLEAVMLVLKQLPSSDCYVMEELGNITQLSKNVSNSLQTVQIRAMFLAFLNNELLDVYKGRNEDWTPKVFFIKSHLSSRLFHLLVGSERVSAQSIVDKILNHETQDLGLKFTPVDLLPSVRKAYYAHSSIEKEVLCQSLLLTMTFMDIAVHLNEESISKVSSRNV